MVSNYSWVREKVWSLMMPSFLSLTRCTFANHSCVFVCVYVCMHTCVFEYKKFTIRIESWDLLKSMLIIGCNSLIICPLFTDSSNNKNNRRNQAKSLHKFNKIKSIGKNKVPILNHKSTVRINQILIRRQSNATQFGSN